ncbi:MAG TPA: hypothetical protein VMX18_00385 [Candidatus Bipolaricaulota bacterium]|nr:hypothetical protein [Candidatus Bipolaricaulota bacterium]
MVESIRESLPAAKPARRPGKKNIRPVLSSFELDKISSEDEKIIKSFWRAIDMDVDPAANIVIYSQDLIEGDPEARKQMENAFDRLRNKKALNFPDQRKLHFEQIVDEIALADFLPVGIRTRKSDPIPTNGKLYLIDEYGKLNWYFGEAKEDKVMDLRPFEAIGASMLPSFGEGALKKLMDAVIEKQMAAAEKKMS